MKTLKPSQENKSKDVINYTGNKGKPQMKKIEIPKLDMRNLNEEEEKSKFII